MVGMSDHIKTNSVAQHIKDKHDAEVAARNARPLLSVSDALRNLCEAVTSQREEDINSALHDGRRALELKDTPQ